MSSTPSPLGSSLIFDDEPTRLAKQTATDALVSQSRAATPASVLNQRKQPRLSVAEANLATWDDLRERFLATRRDDRPGWVKALDILDLPRNQILSHLAPGLERKARERGDVAALGAGRVNFSDALGELGLKPGVIRGILGFVGDVALDPLTYLGPTGWGLKVANEAGQGVRIGLRGTRALRSGIKAVGRGGLNAAPAEVAGLFRVAAKSAPAGLDNAGLAAHLSEKVLGRVTSGKVGRAFSRVGGDVSHKGGILANFDQFGLAGQLDDEAQAARDFIKQYGKGTSPGLRLGKNATSTIAHIPFTEWGIHVPAISGDAVAARDALHIAGASGKVNPVRAAGPGVAAVKARLDLMDDVVNGLAPPDVGGTTGTTVQRIRQDIENLIDGTVERQRAIAPATPDGIGDVLALRRLNEQAKATYDAIEARMRTLTPPESLHGAGGALDPTKDALSALADANLRYADAIKGAAKNWAAGTDSEAAHAAVKRLLGTDDDVIGWSALASMASAAGRLPDSGVTADLLNRADRATKTVFGQPGGRLRSMHRFLQNSLTTGSREVFNSTERAASAAILQALDAAGISNPTTADYEKASNLLLAYTHAVRNEQAIADPLRKVEPYFPFKFGSDTEPEEWAKLIEDAQKDGFFSKSADGKAISDRLKEIAAQHADLYDTLGSQEMADRILAERNVGYIPHVTTPGTNQRIAVAKRQSLTRGPLKKAQGEASEAFQKERSTLQYRFTDSDGKPQRFWEKDRWVMGMKPAEIEALRLESPPAARHVEDLQRWIGEYDARFAEEPGFAEKFGPRNTSQWELNEMVRQGAFDLMLGGRDPIPGGFADLNGATVLAARAMSHERAVARRTWLEYVKQFGVAIDPNITGRLKSGDRLVLKDGSEARFYRDPRTSRVWYEHGGQRYRPIDGLNGVPKDNPILQAIGDSKAMLYHEDVARLIEESARLYEDDTVVRLLDQITGAWKTATLMHPSWTVGNVIGDGLNMLMGGARAQDIARNAKVMAQIIANADNPAKLAGLSVNIRGVDVPAAQFVNDLRQARLLGTNRHAETVLQTLGHKLWVLPSRLAGAEARKGAKGLARDFSPAALKGDFLERLNAEAAGHRVLNGAKAAGFVANDRLTRRVIAPWFRINEGVSDYMRALAYASHLEQGHDIPGAVQRTIRSMFDYSDATRIERSYFKRLWPFFSWLRLNGAYQMKLLMERPIYVGSFPLLQHAIEESINGDRNVPMSARPAWMRNQLALMVGSDPNERFALMLAGGLPIEQALVGISALTGGVDGAQDFLRYFTTNLNPAIRAPLEVGAGSEFYTGRTIGPQGDFSVPGYLANQFRPTREIGKIAETVGRQGVAQAATRLAVGGREQGADDERLRVSRLREFRDEEDRLRKAISTATYRNDPRASVRARASQLRLYASMIQAGFADEVPRWALAQLEQLQPAQVP